MEPNQERTQNSGIIIIGIVAVLALIIAWYAFNRSGEDVFPTVADESLEAAQEVETATDRAAVATKQAVVDARLTTAKAKAQTELAALETRVEAGEVYEDVEADIDAIQADLEVAYENASAEAQADWEKTKETFADLEQSLRDGTADALEFFAKISLSLGTDVRVDEEEEIEVSEDEV